MNIEKLKAITQASIPARKQREREEKLAEERRLAQLEEERIGKIRNEAEAIFQAAQPGILKKAEQGLNHYRVCGAKTAYGPQGPTAIDQAIMDRFEQEGFHAYIQTIWRSSYDDHYGWSDAEHPSYHIDITW